MERGTRAQLPTSLTSRAKEVREIARTRSQGRHMVSCKRSQMKLSFGMIFSVILIIFFIAFGIYAIQKFLSMQEKIQIGQFAEALQSDVNRMWRADQGSEETEYTLPLKVKGICFKNNEYENLIFQSSEFIEGKKIDNLDIGKITKEKDPYCIEAINGKIRLIIRKNFGNNLVDIK